MAQALHPIRLFEIITLWNRVPTAQTDVLCEKRDLSGTKHRAFP
jgi:hypothetical protein